MEFIHHVVMTPRERLINPGPLQYRELEGSYQERPTQPVRLKLCETATCEAHRKRASGDVVGTQGRLCNAELHVKVADSVVHVRVTRDSANGVDLRFRVRTITQVHLGQAEVGSVNYGLIDSLQQEDERIVGHSVALGHHPPRG